MILPTTGGQHYVLLLIPALLRELERVGVGRVIAKSGLPEQDVTRLVFQSRALNRALPEEPASLEPGLWPDLVHWAQVLSTLVNLACQEELDQAREQAVHQFLPQARHNLAREVARQRRRGDIDFQLAGLVRPQSRSRHAEEICMEALRLERERRFRSLQRFSAEGLSRHQAAVVRSAKAYVCVQMVSPPEDFDQLDLVIRLLDLLNSEMVGARSQHRALASDPDIANIVLGVGNLLFREELALSPGTASTGN
ncbi:MAG: hypothetical protein R3175_08980 [Marinobacter sp.]|uniref:hypothetical protein n=1 Tax=Marinobacter sp. TaxID=50741 RepID=UPI00299CD519|nr:hypothetical protein [Marinobacter sp.]MDX1756177.1 hypothetical protein [Marinobacter sp.]